ncbi:MAG: peptidoglycan-binding protein [Ilumatobacter sp.]
MKDSSPRRRSHAAEIGPPGLSRRQILLAAVAATATVGYSSARAITGSSITGQLTSAASHAKRPATVADLDAAALDSARPPASSTPTTTASEEERFIDQTVAEGMSGPDVEAVQQRLVELAFDPGPVDGVFGPMTRQAVWALEKLVFETPRTEIRGVITPAMFEAISRDVLISPRREPGGTHMEVYLPEQVAILFVDSVADTISHVSSGEGIEWCAVVDVDTEDGETEEQGICGISITPGGVYEFNRRVDGWRNAKLGRLYKPVYFNYGIAIHGATSVPEYPASRGCVRFPMHIADYLPDRIELGDAIYVFDGVESPETYGPQPMIFDYPDPNWEPPEQSGDGSTNEPAASPESSVVDDVESPDLSVEPVEPPTSQDPVQVEPGTGQPDPLPASVEQPPTETG